MRIAMFFLVVFFVGVNESLAQITDLFVSASSVAVKILKLPLVSRNIELDEMRCGGDYFLRESNPETLPLGVKTGTLTESGNSLRGVFFLKTRHRTVLDESKGDPTIEYGVLSSFVVVFTPSKKIPWLFIGDGATIIVRLSEAEYKKASKCLPEPST